MTQPLQFQLLDLPPQDLAAAKARLQHQACGYAAVPGTGPAGETCKTCRHAYAVEFARRYWKCDRIRPTRGLGTDIRLKAPACRRWQAKEAPA